MFRTNEKLQNIPLSTFVEQIQPRFRGRFLNSWALPFYKHVFSQIKEEPFRVLYSSIGRPNYPVNILFGLEIIAAMFSYTVEEVIAAFHFDRRVQLALGVIDIEAHYVTERTLFEFRERLYLHALKNPEQDLVSDQFHILTKHIIEVIQIITNEMRMDSTFIMPNIRTAGRLSLAYDVLFKAVKACPADILSDELLEVLNPKFKTELLYKVKSRETQGRLDSMLQLSSTLVNAAKNANDKNLAKKPELQMLERFLNEQAEYDEDKEAFVAKKPIKGTVSANLQSAYDDKATCRKKRDEVHIGYVANIAETCADENLVQVVVDYSLHQNNVADTTIIKESLPELAEDMEVERVFVDGGYYGSSVQELADDLGVEMHYTDMTGRDPEKLPLTDFIFDGDKVTHCPQGHPSEISIHDENNKSILVHFNKDICSTCELRDKCPTKPRKKAQTITITESQRMAAETRKKIEDKTQHRADVSKRAAIEGTNSTIKRNGAGKLRVRGQHKCKTIFGFIMMGHNFRQLHRYMVGDVRRSLKDAERAKKKACFNAPKAA